MYKKFEQLIHKQKSDGKKQLSVCTALTLKLTKYTRCREHIQGLKIITATHLLNTGHRHGTITYTLGIMRAHKKVKLSPYQAVEACRVVRS
jgi:hypothetical protein